MLAFTSARHWWPATSSPVPRSLSSMSEPLIDIHMQVMWNRLLSVVEEQAQTLIRTAFSTSVREAGDLSAGIFDLEGRMLAQAVTGTPGHVNAMAESVAHFIKDIGPQNIFEGDVYITNDPWKGTGHLHDITVVTPSFHHGKLVGYFASTAHVVDVGGFGPDAREVYEACRRRKHSMGPSHECPPHERCDRWQGR